MWKQTPQSLQTIFHEHTYDPTIETRVFSQPTFASSTGNIDMCMSFSILKLVQPLMHLKCDNSPSSSPFFSSSSSSTHFKTVHFARSLTHSLFHWFSQLLNVYKSERKWMKFICLQSLLFEFSHMVFTHSLIRSLVVCCSLLAVTSHTINSLLHYTWNECGSLGVNGEETFIGKHHSKYKVLHKKNCDDMLHFRNRALTSKPIFLQFHLLFFSLSLHNFILYLLGCFFFFRWLFSFWISFYTFLWLYTVILFIFSLALLFSILSFHFVAPLHLVYSFSRDNVARVR